MPIIKNPVTPLMKWHTSVSMSGSGPAYSAKTTKPPQAPAYKAAVSSFE